jgi:hypothetical protein
MMKAMQQHTQVALRGSKNQHTLVFEFIILYP